MPTTDQNLKEAFAGESQANRKYLAFAKKAEIEGFPQVAKLFRAAAEAETIHAHGHLAAMDGVGSTAANLRAAFEGETHEAEVMYPPMVEQAEIDGPRAKRMFTFAMKAEAVHAHIYAKALESVEKSQDLTGVSFFLCPFCGNIEIGEAPEQCPICGGKKDKFVPF